MLRCIPAVEKESCFALKGGTAINFFHWDMPRLSVDIDLTYLPIEPRDESLENISNALNRIAQRIVQTIPRAKVQETKRKGTGQISKLVVHAENKQVKIEPNEILRGAVGGTEKRNLVRKAVQEFELDLKITSLTFNDLYAGKLCAALDRQHPRDIFDMRILLKSRGITEKIRQAFVVYLASHDRPIHELIDPTRKDISNIYETDFLDMAQEKVTLKELIGVREQYIELVRTNLSDRERRFLLSFKTGNPDWSLLGLPQAEDLPALKWKLINIKKMTKAKHEEYIEKLKRKLEL